MQQVTCYTASADTLCNIKGDHIARHTENVVTYVCSCSQGVLMQQRLLQHAKVRRKVRVNVYTWYDLVFEWQLLLYCNGRLPMFRLIAPSNQRYSSHRSMNASRHISSKLPNCLRELVGNFGRHADEEFQHCRLKFYEQKIFNVSELIIEWIQIRKASWSGNKTIRQEIVDLSNA